MPNQLLPVSPSNHPDAGKFHNYKPALKTVLRQVKPCWEMGNFLARVTKSSQLWEHGKDPQDQNGPPSALEESPSKRERGSRRQPLADSNVNQGQPQPAPGSHLELESDQKSDQWLGYKKSPPVLPNPPPASAAVKPVKQYTCEFCSAVLESRSHLKRHLRAHDKDKLCERCGQSFHSKRALRSHVLATGHLKPRLFCSECPASFVLSTGLQRHQVRKHDRYRKSRSNWAVRKRPVWDPSSSPAAPCAICGKSFATAEMLRLHMRSHSAKAFPCSQCREILPSKRHLRLHEEQKHFQAVKGKGHLCEECGVSFRSQAALRSHFAIHSGDKRNTRSGTVEKIPDSNPPSDLSTSLGITPSSISDEEYLSDDQSFSSASSTDQSFATAALSLNISQQLRLFPDFVATGAASDASISHHSFWVGSPVPGSYKCVFCSATFDLRLFLESHLRLHTRRAYQCSACKFNFSTHLQRTVHFLQNH